MRNVRGFGNEFDHCPFIGFGVSQLGSIRSVFIRTFAKAAERFKRVKPLIFSVVSSIDSFQRTENNESSFTRIRFDSSRAGAIFDSFDEEIRSEFNSIATILPSQRTIKTQM